MPATYLGTDLRKAVTLTEELVTGQKAIPPRTSQPLHHRELVRKLKRNRPELDEVIRDKFLKIGSSFDIQEIYEANHNLINDISAALTLGDISFLQFNLDWLTGLINQKAVDPSTLKSYFKVYSEALSQILGPESRPIVNWLNTSVSDVK